MARIYDDEKTYVNQKPALVRASDLLNPDIQREPEVIPHNTMRFDVSLGHIYAMFDNEMVTKEQIVEAIRKAIIQAIDSTVGAALDGVPIPGGAYVHQERDSVMLHRECISFDLS